MSIELTEETEEVLLEAGREAVGELVGDGFDQEEATHLLVEVLDAILVWRALLGEPLASVMEAADGPAIEAALSRLVPLVEAALFDPDKIDGRADRAEAKGRSKLAAIRRKRAERIRARRAKRAEG